MSSFQAAQPNNAYALTVRPRFDSRMSLLLSAQAFPIYVFRQVSAVLVILWTVITGGTFRLAFSRKSHKIKYSNRVKPSPSPLLSQQWPSQANLPPPFRPRLKTTSFLPRTGPWMSPGAETLHLIATITSPLFP
jgi:hypothetical protein